jgi:hypothetical protein
MKSSQLLIWRVRGLPGRLERFFLGDARRDVMGSNRFD